MIMWIVAIVVVWILGIGIVGAVWEDRNNYDSRWFNGLDSAFFVIFWFIALPIFIIYIAGRLIAYIFFCIYDALKPRRRRH